jgi:hypothetical protein
MERKTIWNCKIKVRVWKEVYSNKTKSTKLSHLFKDYNRTELLKGNTDEELMDLDGINSHKRKQLEILYRGKYSCKIQILELEKLSSHGLTNYEI